jgi:2-polyprenyl-3-methyl-5-hydroxy-6-metoxy-1,4-benzoquinol methylase
MCGTAADPANCPSCGRACSETIATRDEVAREIVVRDVFYRRRLGLQSRRDADRRDVLDVAFARPATVHRCTHCDIFVRSDGGASEAIFASDRYSERTLESLRRFHEASFAAKEWLPELLPRGARVLEVGSYVGGFLDVARSLDWDATGLDIGEDTTRFTRERGHQVGAASLEELELPARAFDAVFIWNCFEQLSEPRRVLERSRELVSPGGLVVIRTPDASLYSAKHDDQRFLAYSNLLGFPHRYGFTRRSLERLAGEAGLRLRALRHDAAMRPHRERMPEWAQREESQVDARAWMDAVFERQ